MNIYVGNLPYAATESDLERLFKEYGRVVEVAIIRDRFDGRPRGFGFVEMENREDGEQAIEALDGYVLTGRPLKVNVARERGARTPSRERRQPRQSTRSEKIDSPESQRSPGETFHNPYTFVPSPPRHDIKLDEFAGDFNPLEKKLNHSSLQTKLWTGYIPIKLTTVTPLVLLKGDGKERDASEHQKYDVLDYLPEPSLRGMLRSAYEVVTNSRYACFRNDDRLAYRMIPRESLEIIPAIIENGKDPDELEARLYPGTSDITPQGPKGPMYAAMLTLYHRDSDTNSECVGRYDPKTGDKIWAEIDRRRHRRGYEYWKAVKVWATKPSVPENIVEGRVLITNANMGNKHDERIFFNPMETTLSVTDPLKKAWHMRIQSYREAHAESDIFKRRGAEDAPWKKIGRDPGDTAWSPHLYEDGKIKDRWGRDAHDALELQEGDMVYARCKFDENGEVSDIKDLFPVMISRELYTDSPAALLDSSLQPAGTINELSPADRLFGWVPQQKQDSEQESSRGYKSRMRVVCEDGARPEIVEKIEGGPLPLMILGQPKPAQGRFYVAKDDEGTPQHGVSKKDAGYDVKRGNRLRGRKQYWHHKGLEAENAPDYWKASAEDRTQQQIHDRYQEYRRPDKFDKRNQGLEPQTDSQNRSITGWVKPGMTFEVTLYVQNMQPEEVGVLLWLLTLNNDIKDDGDKHYFKLGYGKPLGFGSVEMEIDEARLEKDCLPLGTGEDWKAHYTDLNANSPATLDADMQRECIQQFQDSMINAYQEQNFNNLSFIAGFLRVLRGPIDDAPIHYPRSTSEPKPEGENFRWFTANESGSKRSLPAVTDETGLPYEP